jgi:hypothetical protein
LLFETSVLRSETPPVKTSQEEVSRPHGSEEK